MKLFSKNNSATNKLTAISILPLLFFAGRLFLILALLPNDLHGYGDFQNYFDVASLPGLPFFHYWTEYPPLYAFSIEFVYFLASGNQILFDFILYFLLTIAGSISIWLFSEIAKLLDSAEGTVALRSIIFFGLLSFISYSWWYFDIIPVCLMLAAIYTFIRHKDTTTSLWLGIGILTKWFPLLLLPAMFRFRKLKSFLKITAYALGITIAVWGILYIFSPQMTRASLQSQPSRSSWQTVWALIDGNMTTGAFVPVEERIWTEAATFDRGNPAVIPSWMTFLVLGGLGFWIVIKSKIKSYSDVISLIGITWALFLIWSPGWSPQWVLYILPIILVTMPINTSFLFCLGLLLVTYLEWPTLLPHNLFSGLWLIVPLRLLILFGMILQWLKGINHKSVQIEN